MTNICDGSHFDKNFVIFLVYTSVHLQKKLYKTGDFDKK